MSLHVFLDQSSGLVLVFKLTMDRSIVLMVHEVVYLQVNYDVGILQIPLPYCGRPWLFWLK